LVLNIRFSEIRCMNLFSAESRSIAFLHYEIIDRSNWTVSRSIQFLHYKIIDRSNWTVCQLIQFLHYKIIDRSNILSQIFTHFSTYITKSLDRFRLLIRFDSLIARSILRHWSLIHIFILLGLKSYFKIFYLIS